MLHHCATGGGCHQHPVQTFDDASGSFSGPDHEYPSYLELTLTATDSGGLSDTETIRLDPQTVDLTFQTNPAGLQLTVGASSQAAPFTRTVIVGSSNSVTAPRRRPGGRSYGFQSWSDGGAQSHNIVAPATATTYTATYQEGWVSHARFNSSRPERRCRPATCWPTPSHTGPGARGPTAGQRQQPDHQGSQLGSLPRPALRHPDPPAERGSHQRRLGAGQPNSTYRVHLVSGDPSQVNSVFRVNVEGVLVVSGTPTRPPAGSRARPPSSSATAA